jgi:hypothetical protein
LTDKKLFVVSPTNLPHIRAALGELQVGDQVRVGPPDRTLAQNALLHSILTDISKQVEWHGNLLSVVVGKRLCMAAWLREINQQPLLIPAIDGQGIDIVFEHTSSLSLRQCAELIEWCYAFGAEHDVKFRR